MMTRKHYVAVAEAMKDTWDELRSEQDNSELAGVGMALDLLAMKLSAIYKEDNPLFSQGKFLAASGCQ